MSKYSKNTTRKRGGRMMMDFNSRIIPYYSPISSKGGSKRKFTKNKKNNKNKTNKSRTRRVR
jgi:hypothetical protein